MQSLFNTLNCLPKIFNFWLFFIRHPLCGCREIFEKLFPLNAVFTFGTLSCLEALAGGTEVPFRLEPFTITKVVTIYFFKKSCISDLFDLHICNFGVWAQTHLIIKRGKITYTYSCFYPSSTMVMFSTFQRFPYATQEKIRFLVPGATSPSQLVHFYFFNDFYFYWIPFPISLHLDPFFSLLFYAYNWKSELLASSLNCKRAWRLKLKRMEIELRIDGCTWSLYLIEVQLFNNPLCDYRIKEQGKSEKSKQKR